MYVRDDVAKSAAAATGMGSAAISNFFCKVADGVGSSALSCHDVSEGPSASAYFDLVLETTDAWPEEGDVVIFSPHAGTSTES